MRLYTNRKGDWAGTQKDAGNWGGFFPVDVPTIKPELLKFLNIYKVKETILYIRSKGHRVDAIGWQGHINLSSSTKDFIEDTDNTLNKLSELVDWAHANDLEFHITELDYKIKDKSNIIVQHQIQALLYSKIISLLESKTVTGVVALNLWDMGERFKKNRGYFQSIYDADLKPTPAYQIIKNALKN